MLDDNSKKTILILSAIVLMVLSIMPVNAAPIIISEAQSYRNWDDTAWIKNSDLRIGTNKYPYLISENVNTKTFTIGTDKLNIPKNIVDVFHLSPDKISFEIHTTKNGIATKSIANGTGKRYIQIPESSLNLRFLFDDIKPDVMIDNGTDQWYVDESTYWYSKVSGNIRFNFLTAPYASLKSTDKIIFKFNSYNVSSASTLNIDGGLYHVNTSFICETTCLTIGANNITLDLMGYTLSYANSTTGIGITNTGYDNVTIMNGTLNQINSTAINTRGVFWYNEANNGNISKLNISFNGVGNYGILMQSSCNNNTITSNNNYNYTSGLGIFLSTSSNNNTITSNNNYNYTSGYGILLSASSNNNTITSNNNYNFTTGIGIYLSASSNNNTITSNNNYNFTEGSGIFLYYSLNNTITSNNNYNYTSGYGIYLYYSLNNTITSNNNYNFTEGSGILLSTSSNNNTITSNNNYNFTEGSGIFLYSSCNNNTITSNVVNLNTGTGLSLLSSNSNIFDSNIFTTNSTTSTVEDIRIVNSGRNNSFINSDFTKARKIEFNDALVSEFNQSQDGGISYVNTNVSVASTTNRSIMNWNQLNITFTEKFTGTTTANYSVNGLMANTVYQVLNDTAIDYTLISDSAGTISDFKINFTTTTKIIIIRVLVTVETPTSLQNTTGNFWIRHSWLGDSQSYNVSINGTWYNGTTNLFFNNSVMFPHDWSNISVAGFNVTGGTSNLSSFVSQNTQIPNNVPSFSAINNKIADVGSWLNFTVSGIDIDNDLLTYSSNNTIGTFNTSTGSFSYFASATDEGNYTFYFSVTDNYSATYSQNVDIQVRSITTLLLSMISQLPTKDDVSSAGVMGFMGGIMGGVLAIAVLRKYRRI